LTFGRSPPASWFELFLRLLADHNGGPELGEAVWSLLMSIRSFESVQAAIESGGVDWSDGGGAADLARIVYSLQLLSAQLAPAEEGAPPPPLPAAVAPLAGWRASEERVVDDLCQLMVFLRGLPARVSGRQSMRRTDAVAEISLRFYSFPLRCLS
jgi:hypothetical protein